LSSFDRSLGATQRWRLDLAYDGNGLSGFAYQPETVTVVGLLRETLARTLRLDEEPMVVGAGRTDAGVHAFAQVVHVDLPARFFEEDRGPETGRLVYSLNKQLAGRVRIMKAQAVPADFHARHSATWREYRYLVLEEGPPALGFTSAWSWSVDGPLDVDVMNRSSATIIGTHDFRAFCRRPTNAVVDEPLLREVLAVRWERLEDTWAVTVTGSPALRLTIRAQSFCHNMVRCLVSTMVAIGRGGIDEGTLAERLVSHERDHLPSPAPPGGLSLIGVGYAPVHGGPSGRLRDDVVSSTQTS
jgi:tRNA pseudouridine38-40 synthase